jgi:hypothetical protein
VVAERWKPKSWAQFVTGLDRISHLKPAIKPPPARAGLPVRAALALGKSQWQPFKSTSLNTHSRSCQNNNPRLFEKTVGRSVNRRAGSSFEFWNDGNGGARSSQPASPQTEAAAVTRTSRAAGQPTTQRHPELQVRHHRISLPSCILVPASTLLACPSWDPALHSRNFVSPADDVLNAVDD